MYPVQQVLRERAGDEPRLRQVFSQRRQLRRALPRVGHRHPGTATRAPARHRQPGRTEAEDEDVLAGEVFHIGHRSFRVDRPSRHSSMVMIQKRTTTCDSFQPTFSK